MLLKLDAKLKIDDILYLQNIADKLSKDDLGKIGQDVTKTYNTDKNSRFKWEQMTKKVIKLASLEKERKDTPWMNASNVKTSIIATCCLQFAAKTYPEIIRNGKVVSISVVGSDPDNTKQDAAQIIAQFMNHQVLVENDFWEDHLDKLLHNLPLTGVSFKKTYYNPMKKANISELCSFDEVFIHNNIKSLEGARRVTHLIKQHKNEIVERINYGLYSDVEDSLLDNPGMAEEGDEDHTVLEQHRYLDLDGDGYEEPYVVTVLERSSKVLRIIARYDSEDIIRSPRGAIRRIRPVQYFTDFHCIPNPDGSYWSLGFGHLLYNTVESINSVQNQLIDAGTLSNLQTGIAGRGLRIKGGEFKVKPGNIVRLDAATNGPIRDEIHMLDFKPPSPVLLQLLGILTQDAKELSSMTEPNTGTAEVQNVAQNVMSSQIEQGAKVFTGIQRRLFRGLKKEFEKLYRLNSIFLEPQSEFLIGKDQHALSAEDFKLENIALKPVADPTVSSDAQRRMRAGQLAQLFDNQIIAGQMNPYHCALEMVEQLYPDKATQFVIAPKPDAPPPLEVLQFQSEQHDKENQQKLDQDALILKAGDQKIKAHLADHEARKMDAERIKLLAEAEAARAAPELKARDQANEIFLASHKGAIDIHKEKLKADSKPKPTEGV